VPRIVPRLYRRRAIGHARERRLRPLERCAHIVVGDDPIALEDADRLVPGHAHRHGLVDAGRHEVADGRTPEIVEDQRGLHDGLARAVEHRATVAADLRLGKPGRDARSRSRLAEVADRVAVPMEDEPRLRPLPGQDVQSTMLTELLAFLDELLSYLESVRDVHGEDGRPVRRSPEIERLTQKTRALRDAVSVERQKT
jgi:hypothetical protein